MFLYSLLLILTFSACKAYRNLENIEPKTAKDLKIAPFDRSSIAKLVPGDQIIVSTMTGFTYQMIYNNEDGINLVGNVQKVNKNKVSKIEVVKIPINEIELLKVKRVSPAATIVAATIGAAALLGVLWIVALASGSFAIV